MPYTYILDDSNKTPTLPLTADHSTLLFLLGFFYKIKNFFFLLWVNLYMITDTYLHDPPPFNGPFFMTLPFSAVSKSCDPPSVSTSPPPLLISDKSLRGIEFEKKRYRLLPTIFILPHLNSLGFCCCCMFFFVPERSSRSSARCNGQRRVGNPPVLTCYRRSGSKVRRKNIREESTPYPTPSPFFLLTSFRVIPSI